MSFESFKKKAQKFLSQQCVAVVGVSKSKPNDPANVIYQKLREEGHTVFPVNPNHDEFDGRFCYHSVFELPPGACAALIFTHPNVTPKVTQECYEAGIKHIWVHKGMGFGSYSAEASSFFKDKPEINYLDRGCPMMFIHEADWFHRAVKNVLKWTGEFSNPPRPKKELVS